jgi:hypothetical protein
MHRACVSDITIEKLAEMLEDNQRGLLVARDELAGWFGSFMKYKAAGAGSDVPNWLELHQGGTLRVDRKTGDRRSVYVRHASVSVIGGIQPATLARALREEFFECGLVARLLLASPPKMTKEWTEAEIDEVTSERWSGLVNQLLAFTPYHDAHHRPGPHHIRLGPDAKAIWVRWYNDWAVQQGRAEGEKAALYSKIEAAAARLALIHHCSTLIDLDEDDRCEMGPASMEAGVALARWFAREALRNYAAVKSGEEARAVVQLVEWVRRQGGAVTARQLHRANQARFLTAEAARETLDGLAEQGLGRWEKETTGGRPQEVFRLELTKVTHDRSDESDKSPPEEGEDD